MEMKNKPMLKGRVKLKCNILKTKAQKINKRKLYKTIDY